MKKRTLTLIISALVVASMILTCIPAFAAEVVEDFPTIQSFTDASVAEEDLAKIVNAGINAPSAINQQPWHFSVITDPAVMEEIAGGGDSGGDSGDSAAEGAEDAAPAAEGDSGDSEGGDAAAPAEGDSGDSEGGDAAAPAEGDSGDSEGGDAAAPAEGDSEGGDAAAATSAKASVGDSPVVIVISCTGEATGTDPAFDAGLATMSMAIEAQLLGYGTKIITSPTMVLNGTRQDEFKEMLGIPADQTVIGILLIGVSAQDEADIASSASTRNPIEDVVTFVAP